MTARASVQPIRLPGRLALRLRAALGLRPIDQIGRGTTFAGCPHVSNDGTIIIGEDCYLGSRPIQSHLAVTAAGRIDRQSRRHFVRRGDLFVMRDRNRR